MDDDSFRLLKALSEKEKTNYRDMVLELRLHPKTVRAMLDRLINSGFVKEEGRAEWKRGKKLLYSLTEKGKSKLTNEALERVNEGLRIVEKFSAGLLAERSKLEEWRRASGEAILNVRITEDMPLEERIRRILAEEKRTFGVLTEAYKNMHRLMCEVSLWKLKKLDPEHFDPAKIFIGFGKHGEICFVPAALLKEQDIL